MREFDDKRRQARITDEELALEASVPCSTISRYRHGRQQPTVDKWIEMNLALDRLITQRVQHLMGLG